MNRLSRVFILAILASLFSQLTWARGGEGGVCGGGTPANSLVESSNVDLIQSVTQEIEEIYENEESPVNQLDFCVEVISTGVSAAKTISTPIKCFIKPKKDLKSKLSTGIKLAQVAGKVVNVKVPLLKVPAAALKLSSSENIKETLINTARLAGETANAVCSWVPSSYLSTTGNVLMEGAKICDDVKCLLESKTTTDKLINGATLAVDAAVLTCRLAPIPYVEQAAEVVATGIKTYKTAQSTHQLTSKIANKIVSQGTIESQWVDQPNGIFSIDLETTSQNNDKTSIECELEGKRFWAKALLPKNLYKSGDFTAYGNWANISGGGKKEVVFVLSTPLKDLREKCHLAYYLNEKGLDVPEPGWKKEAERMLNGRKLEFRARTSNYTPTFRTAIKQHKDKQGLHRCKVISN